MIGYGVTYATATFMEDLAGTLVYSYKKEQLIDHYPMTDMTRHVAVGKKNTKITCIIKCTTETQALLIEQIMADDSIQNLYINRHGRFYRRVVTGPNFMMKEKKVNNKLWYFNAEFLCLDPIPYDIDTEGALY